MNKLIMGENTGIWQIRVIDQNGCPWTMFGNEEVLRMFVDEWKKAVEDVSIDQHRLILSVEGYLDTADRAPASLTMNCSHVAGMFLTRLSY